MGHLMMAQILSDARCHDDGEIEHFAWCSTSPQGDKNAMWTPKKNCW
jgi:hypothetical protein